MSASQTPGRRPRPTATGALSMHDLLASCAAAAAVSTPPRAPEPAPRTTAVTVRDHREAA
ncbi:hypothetical protein [Streptomyces sp. CRN 30]|uniref:hypothetical protein n=1 Tax=Streptomyces sp. CRN 30 TaxID=3075613 RepID=UPI002A82D230|nr:hypothetical protein [Streptomyces sp. CRN 30]